MKIEKLPSTNGKPGKLVNIRTVVAIIYDNIYDNI